MRVYVAAPFAARETVLAIHASMERLGLQTAATWPLMSDGEREFTRAEARAVCHSIDADLDDAAAMLVLAADPNGETYCQVGQAIARGIPIVWWSGASILSTNRVGVVQVDTLEEALGMLHTWAATVKETGVVAGQGHRLHVEWARRTLMAMLDQAETEEEASA